MRITSNGRDGTQTTHTPDISLPLTSEDADQLRNAIAKSASVDSVRVVQ